MRPIVICLLLLVAALAGCTDADPRDKGPSTDGADGPQGPLVPPDSSEMPRAHAHDYYGDEAELTLMDSLVALTVAHNHMFDEPPRDQHTHGCDETLASSSQGGSVKFSLPAGNIVPPGTARLDITGSWDSPGITGVRLLYRPPSHDHGPHGEQHLEHTDYMDAGDLTNGQAFTIDVEPTMTDQGHQFHSNWAFFLCASGDGSVQSAQGDIDFSVVAVRAETIPFDPPHPDHWLGRMEVPLGALDWTGEAVTVANQGDAWFHIPLHDGAIVPWGTDHVRVNASARAVDQPAFPFEVRLYYRDAASVEWQYDMVAPDEQGMDMTFVIPIDHGEMDDMDSLDSPYAKKSHWDFWLRVSSTLGTPVPSAGYWTAPHVFDGTVEATVTAVATPVDA